MRAAYASLHAAGVVHGAVHSWHTCTRVSREADEEAYLDGTPLPSTDGVCLVDFTNALLAHDKGFETHMAKEKRYIDRWLVPLAS